MTQKSVLISGASNGGIGSALALAFQERGLLVFAAVRTPSKASDLSQIPNIHILTLDVTSSASISAAVENVKHLTGGKGLDILVNNSGVMSTMPLVDSDIDEGGEGRKVFEVNFWGTLGMVKGFVPQLIERKGMVVNVSSVGGIVNTPWIGLYAASKAALNIMTHTLRVELAPFGITVLIIMTGAVKSSVFANQEPFKLPPDSIYLPIESIIARSAEGKADPERLATDVYARQVVEDVLRRTYGSVYRGNMAMMTSIMASIMPTFLLDGMIAVGRGLDVLTKYLKSGN